MSYHPARSLALRRLFLPEVGSRPGPSRPTPSFRQIQIQIRQLNSPSTPPHSTSPSPPNTPHQPTSTTPTPVLSPHTSPQISSTRLQKYAPRLTSLSHRTGVPFASLAGAFLVLHELTALVPLVILFFILESLGAGAGFVSWVQESGESEGSSGIEEGTVNKGWRGWVRGWIVEGEEKIGRVGRRYGILGYEKADKSKSGPRREKDVQVGEAVVGGTTEKVANALAAYVIVKALLPLRIAASLALAPSFARFALYPIRRIMGRIKPKPPVR